jgi:heme oxygenase (biliverdin-IX-beta and delta-forming)
MFTGPHPGLDKAMSLTELRLRTRPYHERLDSRLQLFSSVQTLEDYRDHIFRFYRILHFVEPELPHFPEWNTLGICWKARAKSALLRADLAALGVAASELESPEPPPALPPLGSFPETVGSLYVIEGSTLGAQKIARHFHEKFGLTAQTGMSFHIGYGFRTSEHWKEFCEGLDRFFRETPESREQTLSAACKAFEAIELTLCSKISPRK